MNVAIHLIAENTTSCPAPHCVVTYVTFMQHLIRFMTPYLHTFFQLVQTGLELMHAWAWCRC